MAVPAPAPATSEPVLAARALRVGYAGEAILPPVELSIRRGQVWALLGHNGAGKTTLLRSLLGLLPPVAGEVHLADDVHVGYVPQRDELDLTVPARVLDMVRTGVDRGWSFLQPLFSREHREAVDRAMRDAHVLDLAREPFGSLSEGQKQRVLFARALVSEPALLVLDEPTSAMDKENEDLVFGLIEQLRDTRDLAVLVITHDIERAVGIADHGIFVDKEHGTAVAGGITEVQRHPGFMRQYGTFLEFISARPEDD